MPGRRRLPRSSPETQGVDPRALDALVADLVALPELHSVMVLRHGAVVAEGWVAPYGPERLHELFSLSKSFTATAVGFAVAEGLLDLDDLLVDHFPDRVPADPDPRLRSLRLRHLLTMTTGHEDEPVIYRAQDWVAEFLAAPLPHEPGTHFLYNTAASYVLAATVQQVTGERLLAYLRPRLLEPLGITGATWDRCPRGVDLGGLGLSLTTEDIAAFGQLFLQDGVWDGRRVLPQGWVAAASAAQVPNGDPVTGGDWWQGYGYQMWRCRHDGYRGDGAFGQLCVVLPEQDVVVAVTAAVADMQQPLDALWRHLLPALSDGPRPADDEGRAALERRLAGLRLDPPSGAPTSPTGARVSGRTIRFADTSVPPEPDGQSWTVPTSAVLETGEDADRLTVRWGRRTVRVDVGHDAPVTNRLRLRRRTPEDVLVSGAWTGPDTYVLTCRFVDSPFVATVTATVDGDDVTLVAELNVAFGATRSVPVTGHLVPSAG